ncbi:MAG: tRNA pseudouridine(38-40) synthase TruA [Anaerolineae bacterium]
MPRLPDGPPPGQRRLRLAVEYDGTDFAGWQAQIEERGRTVQVALEQAILRITGEAVRVVGAGRTDAGVHATGQVAHFDTGWARPLAELQRALAAVLPPDVVVTEAVEAPPGFHARYSARERTYVYTILNRPVRAPLLARTSWHVAMPLDVEAMAAATAPLAGSHDFRAFGQPMRAGASTTRRITRLTVEAQGECIVVTVAADAFLRHMVRRIAFALAEVGRGRLKTEDVAEILASTDPQRLHGLAPPQGLCLVDVTYDDVEWRACGPAT